MAVEPGGTLSHFRLVEKIGEGGMGVVWKAEDTKLRRPVALKILPSGMVADDERRLRFLREARAAAAINHPHIATVYQVDQVDGVMFIAMELLDGSTLRARMGGCPLPLVETLRLATEMAEGLAKAHEVNVIHRDLKPDNVVITSDDHAKILDFGLAKLRAGNTASDGTMSRVETISGEMTRAGRLIGTTAYMSPEQARGGPVDARSDIFSFGVTLYEMVAGRRPFIGATPTDTLSSILKDTPLPPSRFNASIPQELDRIVLECIEKDPRDRYQHTAQLLVDLRKLRRAIESGDRSTSTPGRTFAAAVAGPRLGLVATWPRRIIAAAGLLIIAIFTTKLIGNRELSPSPTLAVHDLVFVGDIDNTTGRRDFDGAIRDAFDQMLAESNFLTVLRGAPLKDLVIAQGLPERSRLDRPAAERICAGGHCTGYLLGSIGTDGSGYRIEARLYRAGSAVPAASAAARAPGEEDLLSVIHEMLLDLREVLGDAPQAIATTPAPTTGSLSAYQAFSKGARLLDDNAARLLFERAIGIDPDFLQAHILLAGAYRNLGDNLAWRRHAEEAYARSEGAHEKLRLQAEVSWLASLHDHHSERERLQAYVRLYPSDPFGPNGLSTLYFEVFEDFEESARQARRHLELAESDLSVSNYCLVQGMLGHAAPLTQLIRDQQGRGRSSAVLAICALWADWARTASGAAVIAEADRLVSDQPALAPYTSQARWLGHLDMGRLDAAEPFAGDVERLGEMTNNRILQAVTMLEHAWVRWRLTGRKPVFSPEQMEFLDSNFHFLRPLTMFAVEIDLSDLLREVSDRHAAREQGSASIAIRDELAFARGALAYLDGDAKTARALIEPMTGNSLVAKRHHLLARIYEALGLWEQAAAEYERIVKSRFGRPLAPFLWHIDQFRLARAYEQMAESEHAREMYERFLEGWKDADPIIPELSEARRRLGLLQSTRSVGRW